MSWLALLLAVGAIGAPRVAHAKGDDDDDEDTVDAGDDDDTDSKPKKSKPMAKGTDDDDEVTDDTDSDEDSSDDDEEEDLDVNDRAAPKKHKKDTQSDDAFKKQDLTGHDVLKTTAKNAFEKDRFYVDKVDTKKTRKKTLIQGSIASTSFIYTERGGAYSATDPELGSSASKFSRVFTDLRLQTDFRHLGGGRWDARVDARVRVVNTPPDRVDGVTGDMTAQSMPGTVSPNHVQSGFNGKNEYDIRELWLVRNGHRADVTLGRQYITDLGAVKIDGARVDYAKSETFTLLGFAGLYPLRGSRSLDTDYIQLKTNDGAEGGKFVSAGGFGGAYRTVNAHGAIGGVVIYPPPSSDESPRVFATSSGYYRSAKQFDLYHFAIIDLVGPSGAALTNLSAGINYRPNPRLRLNGAFNRVDTESLNVQANAFLDTPVTDGTGSNTVVQNDSQLLRVASNQARVGLAAGLGNLQRFEFAASATYRFRPQVSVTSPDGNVRAVLQAAKGAEIYLSFLDRHSVKDARIGVDVLQTIAVGSVAYQRSDVFALRLSVAHDFKKGAGEWEAEASYSKIKDHALGTGCVDVDMPLFTSDQCFGSTSGSTISLGGNVYYRLKQDWMMIGSAFINRLALKRETTGDDPPVTGLTAFYRIAYRF